MSLASFYFFPVSHITFNEILTSLSTVFIKGSHLILQLLKWPCRTSFFTHVEPYIVWSCTFQFGKKNALYGCMPASLVAGP